MQHKNDYSVIAFLENGSPKRWIYVHNLKKFGEFLDSKFPDWEYMNVYERRTREYLKRFYKGSTIPDFLTLFFLTFNILTFINGFNNTATIQIL